MNPLTFVQIGLSMRGTTSIAIKSKTPQEARLQGRRDLSDECEVNNGETLRFVVA